MDNKSMIVKVLIAVVMLELMCVAAPIRNSARRRAQSRQKPKQTITRYSCPMHPEITSAKRGRCPKCGMTLRLVADKFGAATTAPNPAAAPTGDAASISSSRIPDIHVLDQNGK